MPADQRGDQRAGTRRRTRNRKYIHKVAAAHPVLNVYGLVLHVGNDGLPATKRHQRQRRQEMLAHLAVSHPGLAFLVLLERERIHENWRAASELNVIGACVLQAHPEGERFLLNSQCRQANRHSGGAGSRDRVAVAPQILEVAVHHRRRFGQREHAIQLCQRAA